MVIFISTQWALCFVIGGYFLLAIYFQWLLGKIKYQIWNLPQGPVGFPILGSFYTLLKSPSLHVKFSEWANIYGGLYPVDILSMRLIVVSSPTLMKPIFEHPASTGKFDLEPILLLSGGPYGVTSTQGDTWLEQRKFCVRTLHRFGMGKRNEIQRKILLEAEQAVQLIRKEAQENYGIIQSPINLLRAVTSNTLWKIVRGDKFPLDDKKVEKITGDFAEALNTSVKSGLVIFPWLKWIAPKRSGYTDLVQSSKNFHKFVEEQFQEHQKHRQSEGGGDSQMPCDDMIDACLEQMDTANSLGKQKSTFYGVDGWKHSIAIVSEMFAWGGESTLHTLNWMLLNLIHNQTAQRKLQQEIDQVVGTQEPSLLDKSKMPYAEAVLLETLRRCPVIPTTLPHKITQDMDSLCGCKLPKGTLLISNIYHAHMNKKFWGDPESFRPERFISESSEEVSLVMQRKASVIVFNTGKRGCPGEPLVMDVLFLFMIKLFQTFYFLPFPENVKPDFESSGSFMMTAKPYSVLVRERNLE